MSIHDLILKQGRDQAKSLVDPDERYLIDLAAEVLGDESSSRAYLYSGFAMTTLPHRKPENDLSPWRRSNGRFQLLVEPGYIPSGREIFMQGVPFGPRARLILLYLQTEAIVSGSPVVSLGRSMHQWLERMGIKPGGSSYRSVRDQAKRLSACRLTVSWTNEDGRTGFERANIVSAMLLSPPNSGRQGSLWDDTARLSPEFYSALKEHPVPISEAAVRQIQNSSATIDVYVWLAYRLNFIDKPTTVTWPALQAQFGSEYKTLKRFKERFLETLREATAVYPGSKVEVEKTGLKLYPSPPAIPEKSKLRSIG